MSLMPTQCAPDHDCHAPGVGEHAHPASWQASFRPTSHSTCPCAPSSIRLGCLSPRLPVVRAPHWRGVARGGCAPRLVSRQLVLERNGLHVRCLPGGLFPPTPAAPCDAEGLTRLPYVALPAAVAPEHPGGVPLPSLATSAQPQPRRAGLWAAPLGLPRHGGGGGGAKSGFVFPNPCSPEIVTY